MKSLREILPLLDHCTRHSFELTRRQLVKGGVGGGVLAAGSSGLATLAGSAAAHAGNGKGMSLRPVRQSASRRGRRSGTRRPQCHLAAVAGLRMLRARLPQPGDFAGHVV
jgi:hypothetical protein